MGRNGRAEVLLPSMDQIEAERSRVRQVKRRRRVVVRVLYALVIVSAVVVLISSLLFPMLQISGTSMEPTLHKGDIVMMIKTSRYQTGELCTFSWNNKTLIKRVIAVSGDWVEIDESGNVSVNGKKLDEPYLEEKSLGECDIEFPFQVPEKSFFVLGDKRETSIDSRSTVIGCISEDQLVGKVWLRIFPLDSIGPVS